MPRSFNPPKMSRTESDFDRTLRETDDETILRWHQTDKWSGWRHSMIEATAIERGLI